jgi:hypothetical protein
MANTPDRPRRLVSARRTLALGTVAASALAAAADAGPATPDQAKDPRLILAQEGEGTSAPASSGEGEGVSAGGEGEGEGSSPGGEGEGEGEGEGAGQSLEPEVAFLRDLGFMTGHLRAGMALYEAGVLDEAKTHMGHPIEEKYDAVAPQLEQRGFGGLREELLALSGAAESGADAAEVRGLFDQVMATVDAAEAQSLATPRQQLLALAALTRIAGDEYAVAIADNGSVGNRHEYQDSWGFMRTVEAEASRLAASDDPAVAEAGAKVLEQVRATGPAFGDLSGADVPSPDPSILYGAAARMELAALALD